MKDNILHKCIREAFQKSVVLCYYNYRRQVHRRIGRLSYTVFVTRLQVDMITLRYVITCYHNVDFNSCCLYIL